MLNDGKKFLATRNDLYKSGRVNPKNLQPNIYLAIWHSELAGIHQNPTSANNVNPTLNETLLNKYQKISLLTDNISYLQSKEDYTSEEAVTAAKVITNLLQEYNFQDEKTYYLIKESTTSLLNSLTKYQEKKTSSEPQYERIYNLIKKTTTSFLNSLPNYQKKKTSPETQNDRDDAICKLIEPIISFHVKNGNHFDENDRKVLDTDCDTSDDEGKKDFMSYKYKKKT